MAAPLDGVRVIEVANWLAAPSAAALMADLGADIIKIEPPGGDAFRHLSLRSVGHDFDFATNYAFELDNRGKRSITIDLGQPGGAEVVRRLAAGADIFITNLIERRRQQYGLSVQDIEAVNGRLVYVSFSGYGTEGPDADRPGFDYVAFWARSGIMGLLGDPGSAPVLCRPGQGDHATALNLLAATLAALRLRDQTGRGQVVDVTLVGTGLWTIGSDVSAALVSRAQPSPHDRTAPPNPIWNSYCCSDGKWLLLAMPQPEPYWPKFCEMVERPEWKTDPRYASLLTRMKNTRDLTRQIESVFSAADSQAWRKRLDEAGLIWAPVLELPEVIEDETPRALGAFSEVTHSRFGAFETLAAPFTIRGADVSVRGAAPLPGEHTEEVLRAVGFSAEEMADLAARGVFG
jgi:crotonobetainyl-CoA:carnitine CoA-transferase CaiB-like acyl-CoA transferase